ncbi:MAG: hypothetical protein HC887_12920 [Desulfobacteraceae bacterium]|nr:hypothetical protein [Desulfobacteraceae bacterium]
MISENTDQSLHDKATRGEVLTDDEQLLSDDRYESQDKIEAGNFARKYAIDSDEIKRFEGDNIWKQLCNYPHTKRYSWDSAVIAC